MSIRVLVVDDQELVRHGIMTILGSEPDLEVVGGAADGNEAVRLAGDLAPDVVLMDLRMPGLDGLEATRRLMAAPSPPRVIVLTTFDADEHVVAAMRAGASGFLLKDVGRRALAEAVRVVHEGDTLLAPAITLRLVQRHLQAVAPPSPADEGVLARLTARERDVLRHVCEGASNSEIAAGMHLSVSTVKTHVGQLLAKTGSRDRVQLVLFGLRSGAASLA